MFQKELLILSDHCLALVLSWLILRWNHTLKKTLKLNYIHQTKLWDWVELDKYAPHRHSPENYSRTQLCLRMGLANRLGFFNAETFWMAPLDTWCHQTSWYRMGTKISMFTILNCKFWIVNSELNTTIRRVYKNRIDLYLVRVNNPLIFSCFFFCVMWINNCLEKFSMN